LAAVMRRVRSSKNGQMAANFFDNETKESMTRNHNDFRN
jgi:hypothetical protein